MTAPGWIWASAIREEATLCAACAMVAIADAMIGCDQMWITVEEKEGFTGGWSFEPNQHRRLPQDDTMISQRRIQVRACFSRIQGFRRQCGDMLG